MTDLSLDPNRDLPALAMRLGLDFVDLDTVMIDPELFTHLPVEAASRLRVMPIRFDGHALQVAVSNPLDLEAEKRLVRAAKVPVRLVVSSAKQIGDALRRAESSGQMLDSVRSDFAPQIVREDRAGHEQVIDLDTIQDQSGVVLLTNSILIAGLQKQVSDIHIEVFADRVDVKYRIDGVLYPATESLDVKHHAELVSRIKVMAELDIAEKRKPQDGRFRLRIEGRDVDFRVSVLPTQFGEDVVIRVLDKSAVARFGSSLRLEDLGLNGADVNWLRRAVREPHGLVLITGPTGSGKTTTLYAALSEMAEGSEKIITIEDPVEYELDRIVQIAVNEKKGLNFAAGLRSILRHDPDRIMIGEIRDLETAEIAVQASLTGHLVLASVHANNTIEVISRFTHWGIDLHDFVTSLNAVLAQRLLRRNCSECSKPVVLSDDTLRASGLDPQAERDTVWKVGQGCGHCRDTGYAGRTAVIESLTLTPDVAERMIRRAPMGELAAAAEQAGMIRLRKQALDLARQGVTSLAEVDRVIFAE
ncbi:GspE/PulE family protein [Yoonia sediminilitoris]|uniref:Type IV pilus assembly protein PilB n=1 Tax=Yoonia sediminilitoris TaxID=1286148 RepID=A0A2T6KLG3_9RHOB|nr:GspE/PulE family protein [Yoonia sediminilitoris]PUB17055.1 type IV pilus assembly protein PilB [Yoonia sediminilitoris]RCW97350.1 type IV pilus assembly protein PilB [Yoonia sediminilitoris]